jgi:hypothetical protein
MHPPFEISNAALDRLGNAGCVPNQEIGIGRDLSFKVLSPAGELTDAFEGEHYSISHDTRDAWTERLAVQFSIAGRDFWVTPDPVEHLRGDNIEVNTTL